MLSSNLRSFAHVVAEPPPKGWGRWVSVRFAIMSAAVVVAVAVFLLQPRKADEFTPPSPIEIQRPIPAPTGQIVADPSKPKDLSVLVSISKVADKDLIGMKVVSPQGVDLGFIAQVNRDAQGTVVSIGVTNSPPPNASPITQIKVPPTP